MTIAITFLALTLVALATFAGAFIYAALTSDLTGSDVREPAPFVVRRAPAQFRLGTPDHADLDLPVKLPTLPKRAVLAYRVAGGSFVPTYISAQGV